MLTSVALAVPAACRSQKTVNGQRDFPVGGQLISLLGTGDLLVRGEGDDVSAYRDIALPAVKDRDSSRSIPNPGDNIAAQPPRIRAADTWPACRLRRRATDTRSNLDRTCSELGDTRLGALRRLTKWQAFHWRARRPSDVASPASVRW